MACERSDVLANDRNGYVARCIGLMACEGDDVLVNERMYTIKHTIKHARVQLRRSMIDIQVRGGGVIKHIPRLSQAFHSYQRYSNIINAAGTNGFREERREEKKRKEKTRYWLHAHGAGNECDS